MASDVADGSTGSEPSSHLVREVVGIADVARSAGVSMMTVSRVINDKPGVGKDTRERVRQVMKDLNFKPNTAARTLRTGRGNAVGIICLATTLYGPAVTLFGVEQAARAAGFSVNVISIDTITRASLEQAMVQLSQVPVAVVIVISPLSSSAGALRDLPGNLPALAIWAPSDIGIAVAAVDHQRAAANATKHLLDLGHDTVHHVSGPVGWTGTEQRIAGWREALEKAGRVVPEPVEGDWTAQSGCQAGLQLLPDPAVTAIFAANDQMALGVLQAARVLHRTVPESLSVVGYDDGPDSAYYSPPLTTMRQDFKLLGERALRRALTTIGHRAAPTVDTLFEPELIVRESTGPAPKPQR
ncbi:LacI family DNA-binding transcriptional regulator [Kribbella qitaiheensis]|uniref:LacI family DNA-binding transcriptional regulator n=1 Tax=Kribbella qitaiheensis TaxID=1544730 RepID=UPI00360E0AE9